MGKCLIFNCQSEITNGNVDKLGCLKINIRSDSSASPKLLTVAYSPGVGKKMEIVGDSYFTNANDENLGKTLSIEHAVENYIHNSDCTLYIDKYIDMETHRDVEKIFVDDYYNWLEIKSE